MRILFFLSVLLFSVASHAVDPWDGAQGPVKIYKALLKISNQEQVGSPELRVVEEKEFAPASELEDENIPVNYLTIRNFHHSLVTFRHDPSLPLGVIKIDNIARDIFLKGKWATRKITVDHGITDEINEFVIDAADYGVEGYAAGQAPGEYSVEHAIRAAHVSVPSLAISLDAHSFFKVRYENCTKVSIANTEWPIDNPAVAHDLECSTLETMMNMKTTSSG